MANIQWITAIAGVILVILSFICALSSFKKSTSEGIILYTASIVMNILSWVAGFLIFIDALSQVKSGMAGLIYSIFVGLPMLLLSRASKNKPLYIAGLLFNLLIILASTMAIYK